MAETSRLNGAIRALEAASRPLSPSPRPRSARRRRSPPRPMTASSSRWSTTPTTSAPCATACNTCSTARRSCKSGSLAPAVAPIVRIPPNGGETEPVHRQAGARHRRLRHRLAACLDRRGGAQRGAGLPLSAAARGRLLRAGRPARRRARAPPRAIGASTSRPITSAPTPGRSTPRARCWSSIMCEEKRAIRNLPQDAEGGAGHRRRADRRGRPVAGHGLSAAVRASRGRRRDRRHPGDLQGRTTCRAATRMSTATMSKSWSKRASAG